MRIYLDTSVIGGVFARVLLWIQYLCLNSLLREKPQLLFPIFLKQNYYRAPTKIRNYLSTLPKTQIEKVGLTAESRILADAYITEKVVGKTSLIDCQHIAIATIVHADVLASWNFKHIVNLERIRGYNSINLRKGYQLLEIRSPREIFAI
ncbi:hypothetical protein BH11BAC7_BH11BAC7_02950 [soil metagenome]